MVVLTFMNFLESVALSRTVEFYKNGVMLSTLELHNHDDRYKAFMSEFGLDDVKSLDIDGWAESYVIHL